MKIYLLRHGETEYNAQKRYLGKTDLPLSPKGLSELVRADVFPGNVYVSPLRRTAQTAEVLFPDARQIPVPDLREMDFGIFEGHSYRDLKTAPEYREWVNGGCLGQIPGGERKAAFCRRTCAAFAALADRAAGAGEEALVIVAHGGTQMAVMERYALPRGEYFSWCAPCGGGFLLDASRWGGAHSLALLETVRYTKGGGL